MTEFSLLVEGADWTADNGWVVAEVGMAGVGEAEVVGMDVPQTIAVRMICLGSLETLRQIGGANIWVRVE